MLIKKQHNKNIIFLEKLNKIKEQCYLKTQTLRKRLYFDNSTAITQSKKLTITLKSYTICQVRDISNGIDVIEKLINYLNYLCAKQLHTYLKLYAIGGCSVPNQTRTIKKFFYPPIVLGLLVSSQTNLLNCQSTILPRYQKQQVNHKVINYSNSNSLNNKVLAPQLKRHLKHSSVFQKRLYHNSYWGRSLFKLSKKFGSLSTISKKLAQRRNSKRLLTLIRAPFVFKKTREQFSLQKLSSSTVITFENSAEKHFIIQNLRLLKLPTELKLVSHN
uniref:Ribosomal protein S10 n=1 Tax=Ulva fasciata TaxID=111617 RepID=A0A0U2K1A4_9CHLO|nr:ribosomal protein S10 [Ulva fasciata]ALG35731.1 ribosomal protein S10 [Ulva fasciata]AML80007.1 ribosomal protein S10 [Ulva fasciata]QBR54797.1 ribosomal protein S10 [Ulva lactuca]